MKKLIYFLMLTLLISIKCGQLMATEKILEESLIAEESIFSDEKLKIILEEEFKTPEDYKRRFIEALKKDMVYNLTDHDRREENNTSFDRAINQEAFEFMINSSLARLIEIGFLTQEQGKELLSIAVDEYTKAMDIYKKNRHEYPDEIVTLYKKNLDAKTIEA